MTRDYNNLAILVDADDSTRLRENDYALFSFFEIVKLKQTVFMLVGLLVWFL